MKIKMLIISLAIASILSILVNTQGCAKHAPKVVEVTQQDDACTDAPHSYQGADMYICQGDIYGKICCAYGPAGERGCLAVVCRGTCGGDWELNGVQCPE